MPITTHINSENAAKIMPPILPLFAADRIQDAQFYYEGSPEKTYDILNSNNTLYPDASIFKRIFWALTPVFIFFGWLNFFKNVESFMRSKNKNLEKTLDLAVNFISAAGSTAALFLILTSFAYVAPYVIGSVLGVSILYGVYNATKSVMRAVQSENSKEYWDHMLTAAQHLLGIVANSLAFIANLLFFQSGAALSEGLKKINNMFGNGYLPVEIFQQNAAAFMAPAKVLLHSAMNYVFASIGFSLLAFIPSALKINQQTWDILRDKNESKTVEDECEAEFNYIGLTIINSNAPLWKRIVLGVTAIGTLPSLAVGALAFAVIVRPFCVLTFGLPQIIWNVFSSSETNEAVIQATETKDEKSPKKAILIEDIDRKISSLEADELTSKQTSKITMLKGLLFVLGSDNVAADNTELASARSVRAVEEHLETTGYNQYYQSFFQSVGEVEKLALRTKQFDHTAPAARSFYLPR